MKKGDDLKRYFAFIVLILFTFASCNSKKIENPITLKEENSEIICCWINYNEIEELVQSVSTQKEFDELITEKLSLLSNYRINNIFLHVRAFDDSFYVSDLFPISDYAIFNGKLKFDVLEAFIKAGEKLNIKIHAWINPYRLQNDNDFEKISGNDFAHSLKNTENIIITDKAIYYNPASLIIQKRILSGIKEILDNYDVAGIHFDDYFYPTTSDKIDLQMYNDYINNGGEMSIDDFRRTAVNTLISSVYDLVKSYGEDKVFSISPNGNIQNNYSEQYADVELWCNNEGYIDYIIPQLYYGFAHETMPFETVLQQWIEIKNDCVKLIIGLPLYKISSVDNYALSGKDEWINNNDVISRQIKTLLNLDVVSGYSYYSGSVIYSDDVRYDAEKENIAKIIS